LWTFQFSPDGSLPYYWSGEGPSIRADLAGRFTLRLDWDRLTGQLWELDDQLVNFHEVRYSTGELQPRQYEETYRIVPTYSETAFFEGPITGLNGIWTISSNGGTRASIGDDTVYGLPYTIAFNLNEAVFSLTSEIAIDDSRTVLNAPATLVKAIFAGDYSENYVVDAADYVAWRKLDGGQAGWDFWRNNYGLGTVSGGNDASAPEPATAITLLIGGGLLASRRQCSSR
jgi:hypothetical protein